MQNALLGADLEWGRLSALAGVSSFLSFEKTVSDMTSLKFIFLLVTGLIVFSRMTVTAKLAGRKRKFLAGNKYLQIV